MGRSTDPRMAAQARAEIAARLETRRAEVEEMILARLYAVADPTAEHDVEYVRGLRIAMRAAVGFGLAAIRYGDERSGSVPAEMLTQARHAASNRVGLQTVLRRYFAGYTALCDHLMQEARNCSPRVDPSTLHAMQKELAALFDRVVTSISAEYESETARTLRPRPERLALKVKRLLAGELVDTAELDHDFEAWQWGLICIGAEATADFLGAAASTLGWRLLEVRGAERTTWAWFSAGRRFDDEDLARLTALHWPPQVSLALGEPARGLRGWRLTHRQAEAALAVALINPRPITRYADVSVLSSLARDDDLVGFLAHTYLVPLDLDGERGEVLRTTLRVFFSTGRNVTSAAARLGIARQTVTSRLRAVERYIDRPLALCATELELAIRLDELGLTPRGGAS